MSSINDHQRSGITSTSRGWPRIGRWIAVAIAFVVTGESLPALAQRADTPMAVAPPRHLQISRTLNGWIYVPMELKQQYDAAVSRLETLQTDVDEGRLRAAEAQQDLAALKQGLETLRKQIETAQVLVTGPTLSEQTETLEFELGPDRLLAITANQVRVIGWDQPKVKVELKRSVLSFEGKSVDEQLQAIRIRHARGRAEFAGQTDAEREKYEQEYLAGDGAKLTAEQRANRKRFIDQIKDSLAIYSPYLSKDVDQVTVDGLDYQSNKWLSFGVMSQDGDGSVGGARQRHGELTVYVPACAGVVVRGAMRGLIVEGLSAPLTITPHDSTDSNIKGEFAVRNLRGDLTSQDFPLGALTRITGHVLLTLTEEFGFQGAGMSHRDNLRRSGAPRPLKLQIDGVSDGVDLRLGRIDVELKGIEGTIDITNDFGSTRLIAGKAFSPAAHRIVSQSGRIDVELSPEAWASVPVVAATSHGGYGTNIPREQFGDFMLQGTLNHDWTRRSWNGFRTVQKDEGTMATFRVMDRLEQIFQNAERPPGLDLVSRGGTVMVVRN